MLAKQMSQSSEWNHIIELSLTISNRPKIYKMPQVRSWSVKSRHSKKTRSLYRATGHNYGSIATNSRVIHSRASTTEIRKIVGLSSHRWGPNATPSTSHQLAKSKYLCHHNNSKKSSEIMVVVILIRSSCKQLLQQMAANNGSLMQRWYRRSRKWWWSQGW